MLTKQESNRLIKIYLGITLFCGLFGFVYELFSYGVYSGYMMYSFLFPLILGVIVSGLLKIKDLGFYHGWQSIMHNFAIAVLTIGSILQGIVEIYGTTSEFIKYYFIVGGVLIFSSAITWLTTYKKS